MATTDPTPSTNGTTTPQASNGTAMVPAGDVAGGAISAFASEANFIAAQRMAKALASSTLVPAAYQNNLPNVLIAMEMAARIGASVFMVMQSLDIIHGRPSWSSKFLIATVNASGRFTPLRFRWQGKEGTDEWGCRAVARDRETNEECVGPLVTIGMSKAEGWYAKNGSKWKTLPELMIMYRAGGFWTRVYCPELSFGMRTTEEAADTSGFDVVAATTGGVTAGSAAELEAELLGAKPDVPKTDEVVDPQTGEVVGESPRRPRTRAAKPAESADPSGMSAADIAAAERQNAGRETGED